DHASGQVDAVAEHDLDAVERGAGLQRLERASARREALVTRDNLKLPGRDALDSEVAGGVADETARGRDQAVLERPGRALGQRYQRDHRDRAFGDTEVVARRRWAIGGLEQLCTRRHAQRRAVQRSAAQLDLGPGDRTVLLVDDRAGDDACA